MGMDNPQNIDLRKFGEPGSPQRARQIIAVKAMADAGNPAAKNLLDQLLPPPIAKSPDSSASPEPLTQAEIDRKSNYVKQGGWFS